MSKSYFNCKRSKSGDNGNRGGAAPVDETAVTSTILETDSATEGEDLTG
jgi:hypothetical protein